MRLWTFNFPISMMCVALASTLISKALIGRLQNPSAGSASSAFFLDHYFWTSLEFSSHASPDANVDDIPGQLVIGEEPLTYCPRQGAGATLAEYWGKAS
jgi:hypothetical protein